MACLLPFEKIAPSNGINGLVLNSLLQESFFYNHLTFYINSTIFPDNVLFWLLEDER
jgi:hypothetical protein